MAHETVESGPQPVGELAVDSLYLQQKGLPRGRPWQPGESGNPAGRPLGSRNVATRFAEALLDSELELLVKTTIDRALKGNPVALRLCMDRLMPPRRQERVCFAMPPLASLEAAPQALAAIIAAAANGELSAAEARDLTGTVHSYVHAVETRELEGRLQELEEHDRKISERERQRQRR
jgi:hypothetical protein